MLVQTVADAWSWIGLSPSAVLDSNAFGNLLVQAEDGRIWRICPEELSCQIVAESPAEYQELRVDPTFCLDWEAEKLVSAAEAILGSLPEGRCYCLKVPAPLGGAYETDNIGTDSLREIVSFSGEIARQIRDLPNGASIELKVVE